MSTGIHIQATVFGGSLRPRRRVGRWLTLLVGLLVAFAPARALASPCPGDCNVDAEVTIDELVKGVNIALGVMELDECASFDQNNNNNNDDNRGKVTIDELIAAVNMALAGEDVCKEEFAEAGASAVATTAGGW